MIEEIYLALRDADAAMQTEMVAFANTHALNVEIPDCVLPGLMDDATARAAVISAWRERLAGFRGRLSLYAPMQDLNPVSEDSLIARASRGRYIQAVEMAKELGARHLIVPSHYLPLIKAENRLNKWLTEMTRFWEQLLVRAVEGSGMVVVIQNQLGETPEHIKTIVTRLESPNLRAAFSVGHAALFSKRSPNDWVDELGNMLSYVQVCNNDGQTLVPEDFETGQIDLESFLNHLSLLTHGVGLSILAQNMQAIETNHMLLEPFLKMQEEAFTSKSFLV